MLPSRWIELSFPHFGKSNRFAKNLVWCRTAKATRQERISYLNLSFSAFLSWESRSNTLRICRASSPFKKLRSMPRDDRLILDFDALEINLGCSPLTPALRHRHRPAWKTQFRIRQVNKEATRVGSLFLANRYKAN